jgi:glutamine transport system permease protein
MSDLLRVLLPMLLSGLRLTLLIAVVGIAFGFVIGCLVGYALQSERKILRTIAGVYIWIIRAIPLVVLALYMYYVMPKLLGIDLSKETAGIIVLALNSGAFIAEIVRGALQGVPHGQREAGYSLGLTSAQTLFHVVVPPAFRSIIPALCNQFIISIKDTALLTVIAVPEMAQQAQNYQALSFDAFGAYTMLALFYLAIISVLILLQKWLERRLGLKNARRSTLI